jgi:hypothetical protein
MRECLRKITTNLSRCLGRDSTRAPTDQAYNYLLGHKAESTDISDLDLRSNKMDMGFMYTLYVIAATKR